MSKKLWGGRFSKATDALVEEFTRSIQYDYKLAPYDILGSMIHVEVLRRAGYLKGSEASRLYKGLTGLYRDVHNGSYRYDASCEDIHSDIQNKLEARVGEAALKLHTARSRNDQVAFASKLYCKFALAGIQNEMAALAIAFSELADANNDIIMPGFTHLQHAQPVYLKDYLLAYVEMLKRDNERLSVIFSGIKLTMGAGAIAGTPIESGLYNIRMPGKLKGLNIPADGFEISMTVNSIDAVSDRDFVIDMQSAISIIATHLSRFAEDLIIWSAKEFGFIDIDDAYCTGSSLMPQKKNPDVLELIRGSSGRIYGNLISALTMMKGLPLAYNRDMQLDKEPLFDSVERISAELKVLAGLVSSIKFNKDKIETQLEDESLYATDLVYYLVKKGMPFKTAHSVVGKIVRHSQDNNIEVKSMTDSELKKFSDKIVRKDIIKLFNPKVSVESKKSIRRTRA